MYRPSARRAGCPYRRIQHLLAIVRATIGQHRNLVRTGSPRRRLPHRHYLLAIVTNTVFRRLAVSHFRCVGFSVRQTGEAGATNG